MSTSLEEIFHSIQDSLMSIEGVTMVGMGEDDKGDSILVVGIENDNPSLRYVIGALVGEYPFRIEENVKSISLPRSTTKIEIE